MYSFVKNVLCTMSRTNIQPLRIHLFFLRTCLTLLRLDCLLPNPARNCRRPGKQAFRYLVNQPDGSGKGNRILP